MTPAEFRLIHRPVNEDEDDVRADFDADLEATLGHVVRQKDAEIARLREALEAFLVSGVLCRCTLCANARAALRGTEGG